MKTALFTSRIGLIVFAIVSTIFLNPISSYSHYTFFALGYLALDRIGHTAIPSTMKNTFYILMTLYAGWLGERYGGMMFVLFFSLLFSFFPIRQRLYSVPLLVIPLVTMNVTSLTEPLTLVLFVNVSYAVIAGALFILGTASQRKQEIELLYDTLKLNHYELDEARQRMMDYAQKVGDIAQVEERNRISKDIHDDIGHKLIRIKMMMEAALRVIPDDYSKGMELLGLIRDQLGDSMETLRLTVRKLKPDEKILKRYSLKRLIEDFGRDSDIHVQYFISGQPYPLFPSQEVVLYRNAQEAMTNAIRHGSATEVTVSVHYGEFEIVLDVRNNGLLPIKEAIRKGLGLKCMEERIEVLGGTISLDTADQFSIRTILPYRQLDR